MHIELLELALDIDGSQKAWQEPLATRGSPFLPLEPLGLPISAGYLHRRSTLIPFPTFGRCHLHDKAKNLMNCTRMFSLQMSLACSPCFGGDFQPKKVEW